MKVLLLNQTFYPDRAATAQHLTDLAQYLTQAGCEVTAVAARRSYNDPRQLLPARETYHGIKIRRVLSTGFGKHRFFLRFIDAITFEMALVWRLFRLGRQDAVISFTSPPLIGFIGLVFSRLYRAQSVQWLMDINPDLAFAMGHIKSRSLVGRLLTAILEFSLKHSDHIVVLDRWMREKVISHKAKAENITIVPPWPVHDFAPCEEGFPKENAFREEHGLGNKFVVLYSGNQSSGHPLDLALEAALKLRDDPKVVFAFIGSGALVGPIGAFKEKHGLKNIVQLPHQPRERLGESLTFADLHLVVMGNALNGLVHPSKIYGVLATGRPYVFIGPKESYVSDLLRDCPYGFQVEHGDLDTFLQIIHQVRTMTQPELIAIQKNNMAYLAQHFLGDICMGIVRDKILKLASPEPKAATLEKNWSFEKAVHG